MTEATGSAPGNGNPGRKESRTVLKSDVSGSDVFPGPAVRPVGTGGITWGIPSSFSRTPPGQESLS